MVCCFPRRAQEIGGASPRLGFLRRGTLDNIDHSNLLYLFLRVPEVINVGGNFGASAGAIIESQR